MTATMFEYKARDRSGSVQSGTIEGASSAAVARALRDRGFIPLQVQEHKVTTLDREIKIPGFGGKVKSKDVALMSRQLATMVNSGLSLVRALTILQQQAENPVLKSAIADVRSRVEQGSTLSGALEAHPKIFGMLYVAMVRAGEVGGALDETLNRLADTLEGQVKLRSQVKSAMAYPVVVFSLIVLIVIALMVFVVPVFKNMYLDLGGELPVPTRLLIGTSNMVTKFSWLFALVTIGSVAALRRWIATEDGRRKWDTFKLRIPVFGRLVRKVAISRFARTFSVLSRTGVPVLQALDIVGETAGNTVVKDALRDVQASVKRGESVAAPLEEHEVFPPMVTQMMAVGEETGSVETMLAKVADFYDREVDDAVNALTSLIEPILIIVMGVVVGGILICLYLPMFNIGNLVTG